MRKEEIAEAITAFMASAFIHQRLMMLNPKAEPPTPEESKRAYLNDPTIRVITDATVLGIYELLSHNQSMHPSGHSPGN